MSERVLITGITGYLGAGLARYLRSRGTEVHGIIRRGSKVTEEHRNYTLHTDDGTTEGTIGILSAVKPVRVFHLASLFKASHTSADVLPLMESNIVFGARLLEAMSVSGVQELVNTGTSWQNFESQPYNPVALYAATKQAFEDLTRYYVESGRIRAMTLKLTDTYGPGDSRRKIFNLFMGAALSGDALPTTSGEQLIDLVHVDDVVRAFVRGGEILAQGGASSVRLVASGAAITLRALAEKIEAATGRSVPAEWGKLPYRAREMFKPWRADPILEGWKPEVSLEEGIRSVISGA